MVYTVYHSSSRFLYSSAKGKIDQIIGQIWWGVKVPQENLVSTVLMTRRQNLCSCNSCKYLDNSASCNTGQNNHIDGIFDNDDGSISPHLSYETEISFHLKCLQFCNLNIRHIIPNLDELPVVMAKDHCLDILGACETFWQVLFRMSKCLYMVLSYCVKVGRLYRHYENTPIQIYWKVNRRKIENFQTKN